ncbi:MAG: 50S ribosomal protein L15 [Proteobacteria bacterium]|nr:50S ribosomal protein L15 [Pseudomonadota bacterium]
MKLNELRPREGAVKKNKRVGRGPGSGHGKTSCRGGKGQTARAGASIPPYFEGGQMPLVRRIPKRGFKNALFKKEYAIVNLDQLNQFEPQTEITPEFLIEKKIVKDLKDGLKILADGDLKVPLTIKAHKFSKTAIEKIEKAGGKAEVIA